MARIFAAALVVSYHLAYTIWAAKDGKFYGGGEETYVYPELESFTWFGWVGVQIFFVVSGFVISASVNEDSTFTGFLRSRIIRLYPAAFVCSSLTALAIFWNKGLSSTDILIGYFRSITLFPIGPWIDGVYWSLGIEMSFYLAVAALILRRSVNHLEILAVTAGVISGGYLLLSNGLVTASGNRIAQLFLLSHGAYFAIGCVGYFATSRGWSPGRTIVFAALLLTGTLALPNYGLKAHFIFTLAVGIMLLAAKYDVRLSSALPRLSKFAAFFGPITYPIYLLHNELGSLILVECAALGVNRFLALCLTGVLVLFVSVSVALGLEATIRQILRRSTLRLLSTAASK